LNLLVNKISLSLSLSLSLSGHDEKVHGPRTDIFKYNDLQQFFIEKIKMDMLYALVYRVL
jgi:hypothetical protein